MAELTGWLGFLLLAGVLVPFIGRRLKIWRVEGFFFSCHHHGLALVTLLILTVHGLLALTGRRGWGWGALANLKGHALSGIYAWSVLTAVVLLALFLTSRRSRFRAHCWLAGLLVLLVLNHVFR